MTDNATHYKLSARPNFGKPNKCEKGIRFPTKKCIGCDKMDKCQSNLQRIKYAYTEGREIYLESKLEGEASL